MGTFYGNSCTRDLNFRLAKTKVFLSPGACAHVVTSRLGSSELHRTLLAPASPRDRALLDVWEADLSKRSVGGGRAAAGPPTLCPPQLGAKTGRTPSNGDSTLVLVLAQLCWPGRASAAG
jgi:hypothetical protein